jgi:hypothetical protein
MFIKFGVFLGELFIEFIPDDHRSKVRLLKVSVIELKFTFFSGIDGNSDHFGNNLENPAL